MVNAIATESRVISKSTRSFNALYAASIFLSLHLSLVIYMNTGFIDQYISKMYIGVLYIVSSVLSIILFLSMSKIISKTGKHALVLLLSFVEIFVLLGMAFVPNPELIISFFVLHLVVVPLIFFNLDIYMEELIGSEESSTGTRRGLFLTIMSICYAITALISGFLIGDESLNFSYIYIGAALLMIPFVLIIITKFKPQQFNDRAVSFNKNVFRIFWRHKDLRNVFGAQFLLQVFFAWMVIYSALYLSTEIGLTWVEIGIVFFVGLLAYAFFEYPIGVIADRWIGEKELMALGFLVVAVSVSWFVFIESTSIVPWMIVLFISRIGGSLLEVTTESYFFKHAKGDNIDMIGFFRMTRPLSYIVGAGLGSIILFFTDFTFMFLVLAALMIPGFFFAMALHDTK